MLLVKDSTGEMSLYKWGWLVCVEAVEWALYIESNYSVCGCV